MLDSFQLLSVLILSVFYCPLSLKAYAPEVRDYYSTLFSSKEYSIIFLMKVLLLVTIIILEKINMVVPLIQPSYYFSNIFFHLNSTL